MIVKSVLYVVNQLMKSIDLNFYSELKPYHRSQLRSATLYLLHQPIIDRRRQILYRSIKYIDDITIYLQCENALRQSVIQSVMLLGEDSLQRDIKFFWVPVIHPAHIDKVDEVTVIISTHNHHYHPPPLTLTQLFLSSIWFDLSM